MFGRMIDYWLLRPFAHDRRSATEAELDAEAGRDRGFDLRSAEKRLEKLIKRLGGCIPISPGSRCMDIGCGSGELTLALASKIGCRVTGVDVMPRNVERARLAARKAGLQDRAEFLCINVHDLSVEEKFDAVFCCEMLEHVERPGDFLRAIDGLLKPGPDGGKIILVFGPLFHSPLGDHMHEFFKIFVPWRGVLFSERAIMRLRREFYRPTENATSFATIKGGLNGMRYTEFLRYVADRGWGTERLAVNPQLRRRPFLWRLSEFLVRLPWIRDYVATSVYAIFSAPR